MLDKSRFLLFLNKINNELLIETQINESQYLIEYLDNKGRIKLLADTYSAFWYPEIYEWIGEI